MIKRNKKTVTEDRFPHIVQIAIPERGLDPQTNRAILDFHRSQKIRVRFGRAAKNVCRWCFSDAATAEAFKEHFGGTYVFVRKTTSTRTMPNMIVVAFAWDALGYVMSSGAELTAQFDLF